MGEFLRGLLAGRQFQITPPPLPEDIRQQERQRRVFREILGLTPGYIAEEPAAMARMAMLGIGRGPLTQTEMQQRAYELTGAKQQLERSALELANLPEEIKTRLDLLKTNLEQAKGNIEAEKEERGRRGRLEEERKKLKQNFRSFVVGLATKLGREDAEAVADKVESLVESGMSLEAALKATMPEYEESVSQKELERIKKQQETLGEVRLALAEKEAGIQKKLKAEEEAEETKKKAAVAEKDIPRISAISDALQEMKNLENSLMTAGMQQFLTRLGEIENLEFTAKKGDQQAAQLLASLGDRNAYVRAPLERLKSEILAKKKEVLDGLIRHLTGGSPDRQETRIRFWAMLNEPAADAKEQIALMGLKTALLKEIMSVYGGLENFLYPEKKPSYNPQRR